MRLDVWLVLNGMTQTELAEKVGCNRGTVWRAKKGQRVAKDVARAIEKITDGKVLLPTRKPRECKKV